MTITDETVNEICLKEYKATPDSIQRNTVGIAAFVYTIEIHERKYVIKIAESKELICGSAYWLTTLQGYDLPIPKVTGINTNTLPYYLIMTWVPGKDLCLVYRDLSSAQKKHVAQDIFTYQNRIQGLPAPDGYGFLNSYDDTTNLKKSWEEVVESHITRSETRIMENGVFTADYVRRVRRLIPHFREYFSSIKPSAFFDDTTTKNVLVSDGRLSGIIDLDWICFGDRLYVIALTTMSLLAMHADLEYVEYWKELEKLSREREAVLLFYILVFCIDFMSEKGMKFNRDTAEKVEENEILTLQGVFEEHYTKLQQYLK